MIPNTWISPYIDFTEKTFFLYRWCMLIFCEDTLSKSSAPSALASLSADERESHVLSVIRQAASSMHLDIQDDTPLMEAENIKKSRNGLPLRFLSHWFYEYCECNIMCLWMFSMWAWTIFIHFCHFVVKWPWPGWDWFSVCSGVP